jgi:hypothetical protein
MSKQIDGLAHFMLLAFGNHLRHDFGFRLLARGLKERVSNSILTKVVAYTVIIVFVIVFVFVTETSEMDLLHRRRIDLAYTK